MFFIKRKKLINYIQSFSHNVTVSDTEMSIAARQRQVFYEEILKIHEITQNFGVSLRCTIRLNKFDRLAAVILVQTSHRLKNQNIFLNTIAAAAR